MNKTKIGIFLSLMLVLGFCSSCKEQKSNNKLLLNEVLVNNESNYQDDYGVHSAWIEIFNRSYGSDDLAGCYGLMENQDAVHFIRTSNWMPQMPTGLGCMIPARNCLIKS